MVTVGLLVRLVAKAGKEAEVISFLEGGLALVEQEPATIAWFAFRLGPSEFGIFDAFPDDAGRQAHLGGQVAAALMAQAPELLASHRSSSRSTSSRPSCLGSCRSELGRTPAPSDHRSSRVRWHSDNDHRNPAGRRMRPSLRR